MNLIIPIILILSSVAVFFGYVDPNYKGSSSSSSDLASYGVVELKDELSKYQDLASSSTMIKEKRDSLIQKRTTIKTEDQTRLERFLPNNIDNIRLIIEIRKIAEGRNLVAQNVQINDVKNNAAAVGITDSKYGTLSLSFTVNSSYQNFLNLLNDLENNLRLLDITNISFSTTDTGLYNFTVTLNTYWLK